MEIAQAPFKNHEEFINYMTSVVGTLSEKYEMTEEDVVLLADSYKTVAGEYHKLMKKGLVPKENQYQQGDKDMSSVDGYLKNKK